MSIDRASYLLFTAETMRPVSQENRRLETVGTQCQRKFSGLGGALQQCQKAQIARQRISLPPFDGGSESDAHSDSVVDYGRCQQRSVAACSIAGAGHLQHKVLDVQAHLSEARTNPI